ncbi:cytochrome P450 [Lasiosphaeris hirsuta]|uniref:Cytochrome P450 n=1 Tax=Lasiosphaeris hirsuta TaxID=260670 RepID=A0AA40EEG1_9PEZI|nr:cytochrome P450 [Lasiosphaeris hirsuta]
MATAVQITAGLAIAAFLSYLGLIFPSLRQKWRLHAHRASLPPGPRTPKTNLTKPWLWFHALHREFGDVVYLQSGAAPTIILGSAQAAWDLLEKRGAIYSSRPRFVVGGELLSGGLRGLMAPYGAYWRRWRRLLHAGFMARRSETYRPVQRAESAVLMGELLREPEGFRRHVERVQDVRTDEVVTRNNESVGRLVSVNIPGRFAAERYPALRYVPSVFAPWKAQVLRQRREDIKLYTELAGEVREKMARGVARDCFAKHVIQEQAALGMTDLEVAYTAGSPFSAGVETASTSAGSISSFFLACAKFGPQFVPHAQAELDRVVGPGRLPTFDDLPALPYVRAIASETLRWRPIAVLGGTPHASTADDVYKGMFIPKGSTIIAPLWSIHLNETDFPEPHEFRPERFTEDREYPGTSGHSAFGWGRRICPGMHLAQASVDLNIARILWAFDVGAAKDGEGRDIEVDIFAFSDGFNSSPLPFPCSITPRSPEHAAVVEREYQEALEELSAVPTS